MGRYLVHGGKALKGTLSVHGAKNSALPILAATILSPGICTLENVPRLSDVDAMAEIMSTIGVKVTWTGENSLEVDCSDVDNWEINEDLMRKMRSSFIVVGPLLARMGRVKVTYPGGCAIGTRAIDLHLSGLARMGVKIIERHSGHIEFVADNMRGTMIHLDYPSVGATENIMMAAVGAKGLTVINNPAREPEIVDLQNFLNKLGAKVAGAGSDQILVEGVKELGTTKHAIIPDRIVAGTMMIAAAVTNGDVTLTDVIPSHFSVAISKLIEMGALVEVAENSIRVKGQGRLKAVEQIRTAPYPGFPTDMQPQFMAALTTAEGVSVIMEKIFDGRFKHIGELQRMGARISVDDRTAVIRGVEKLTGARVGATDLRAGAALVIAALAAEGSSIIEQVNHIDRGYVALEKQLSSLGATISREGD